MTFTKYIYITLDINVLYLEALLWMCLTWLLPSPATATQKALGPALVIRHADTPLSALGVVYNESWKKKSVWQQRHWDLRGILGKMPHEDWEICSNVFQLVRLRVPAVTRRSVGSILKLKGNV